MTVTGWAIRLFISGAVIELIGLVVTAIGFRHLIADFKAYLDPAYHEFLGFLEKHPMPQSATAKPDTEERFGSVEPAEQAQFLAREIDRLAYQASFHSKINRELLELMSGRLQIDGEMRDRAQRGLAKANHRSVWIGWILVTCGFLLQSISQIMQFIGS
ncbi:hypothetical protein DMB66_43185 [Actinoplanes sp. ATCC 53533]|uniref:hypothetical protein n=1 Tax=Actinoplanes sp. ATCC 53533 TaxID=1288362 RepID=UPI000F7927E2|nr:hypothetical protein [Actinoplanes sp. ATCC 53533]RSM50536.1 hypothetical protein DMB66_43185 [Actinoplanes sp. ATCC 53533]